MVYFRLIVCYNEFITKPRHEDEDNYGNDNKDPYNWYYEGTREVTLPKSKGVG